MKSQLFMESDVVFVQAETSGMYIIRKDRNRLLGGDVTADSDTVESVFKNESIKVTITDNKQNLIRKNFMCTEDRLSLANEFLNDVSSDYENKLKEIDKALETDDREKFMQLTSELFGGVVDGV